MFLDRELSDIQTAKDALTKRCAMHRLVVQLDTLTARARVRGVVSGLKTSLAVAELVKDLLAGRKDRDR